MPSVPEIAADFRRFLAEQQLPDERRAMVEAAIQAFLDFDARRDPALLVPLVTAARSPHKVVFEVGANLLGVLVQVFDAAQEAWLRLSNDSTATARFTAVAFLDQAMPADFTLEIVRRGLEDKSTRVRRKAVEVAVDLDLRALVPRIARLATEDPDEGLRAAVERSLPLLRDGYRLEKESDGGCWVHFRTARARVSVPLWGEPTPEAIRTVIEEALARGLG